MRLRGATKVKVMHFRRTPSDKGLYTLQQMRMWALPIDPRGGHTSVEVIWPDGSVSRGEAVCSDKDNFCRRTGREIALKRALAKKREEREIPW